MCHWHVIINFIDPVSFQQLSQQRQYLELSPPTIATMDSSTVVSGSELFLFVTLAKSKYRFVLLCRIGHLNETWRIFRYPVDEFHRNPSQEKYLLPIRWIKKLWKRVEIRYMKGYHEKGVMVVPFCCYCLLFRFSKNIVTNQCLVIKFVGRSIV